jgi:AcrR family transcriptional regulator
MLGEVQPTRRECILDAAFETIGRYGYRRTSMDDIAVAVGISRPALYQEFKNKADIYRAGVQRFLDNSMESVTDALAEDAPITHRLRKAFDVSIIAPHRMIEEMPHGAEFLSLKNGIAQDIIDEWRAQFCALLEQTFAIEPTLSKAAATHLAATVMNVVAGIKSRGLAADETAAELEKLVGVVGLVG